MAAVELASLSGVRCPGRDANQGFEPGIQLPDSLAVLTWAEGAGKATGLQVPKV